MKIRANGKTYSCICMHTHTHTTLWRRDRLPTLVFMGFPGGSDGKESSCSKGDLGWIPWLGRPPGGGHGNPLQYSCLENPMDRGACWATVHGVAKSQTWLSDSAHTGSIHITHSSLYMRYMC